MLLIEMEMWSSGSAFLYLTSCSALAVLRLQRGDVRVVKVLLVFDISLSFTLFLSVKRNVCILCTGVTDDQTRAWESGTVALHDGGSHLMPPPDPPPFSVSPFQASDKSRMKDLPFHRWLELRDKAGSEVTDRPSAGNREFTDSSDTAVLGL